MKVGGVHSTYLLHFSLAFLINLVLFLLPRAWEEVITPKTTISNNLAGFEQQNCHLSQIEINEVLSFMRYVGAEVSAHNAVPSRIVFLVKLLLDVSSNILFFQ